MLQEKGSGIRPVRGQRRDLGLGGVFGRYCCSLLILVAVERSLISIFAFLFKIRRLEKICSQSG